MRMGDRLDSVEIGAASMRGAGNIGVRARTELAVDDVIVGLHGAPRSKSDNGKIPMAGIFLRSKMDY
jgi:hypothetical protein